MFQRRTSNQNSVGFGSSGRKVQAPIQRRLTDRVLWVCCECDSAGQLLQEQVGLFAKELSAKSPKLHGVAAKIQAAMNQGNAIYKGNNAVRIITPHVSPDLDFTQDDADEDAHSNNAASFHDPPSLGHIATILHMLLKALSHSDLVILAASENTRAHSAVIAGAFLMFGEGYSAKRAWDNKIFSAEDGAKSWDTFTSPQDSQITVLSCLQAIEAQIIHEGGFPIGSSPYNSWMRMSRGPGAALKKAHAMLRTSGKIESGPAETFMREAEKQIEAEGKAWDEELPSNALPRTKAKIPKQSSKSGNWVSGRMPDDGCIFVSETAESSTMPMPQRQVTPQVEDTIPFRPSSVAARNAGNSRTYDKSEDAFRADKESESGVGAIVLPKSGKRIPPQSSRSGNWVSGPMPNVDRWGDVKD